MKKFATYNLLFILDHPVLFENLVFILLWISMSVIIVNIFWDMITIIHRTGPHESTDKLETTEFESWVQQFSAYVISYIYCLYKKGPDVATFKVFRR